MLKMRCLEAESSVFIFDPPPPSPPRTFPLFVFSIGLVVIFFVNGNLQQFTTVESGTYLAWTLSMGCTNSIINPIVYAIKISVVRQRFRRELGRLLLCCFGCCGYKGSLLQPTGVTVFSVDSSAPTAATNQRSPYGAATKKLTRLTRSGQTSHTRLMENHSPVPPIQVQI